MSRKTDLENSWRRNADNWTRAVRDRLIPSRTAGTTGTACCRAVSRAREVAAMLLRI